MTDKREVPATLAEAMDYIASVSVKASSDKEQSFATLNLFSADHKLTVVALAVGGGDMIARTARMFVHIEEPEVAILEIEGWTIRRGVGPDDPDRRRVDMGEIAISNMPPTKRGESLWIYGEDRRGATDMRMYYIDVDEAGRRTVEPFFREGEVEESTVHFEHRFKPLFVAEDMIRKVEDPRDPSIPKEERLRMMVMGPSDPAERRQVIRNLVGKMLAEGAGTTTRAWEENRKQAHQDMTTRIVRSNRPAKP